MARLLFQLSAVLLICALNVLRPVDNITIPSYEFEIDFQHRPVSWHRCPEGWLKIKRRCYKVFFDAVSWNDAEKFCQSFGGSLARINGFNSNRGLGKIIQEFFVKDTSNDKNVKIPVGKQSQLFSWIGFNQEIDGKFYWSNGDTGSEQEGFWSPNNPPFISSIKEKKCCDIGLNETRYGKYRWILHGCEQKRPFVCEIRTCERHEKRCADGRGCICKNWICDGMKDCLDGSDERECNTDVQCGGILSGTTGIFNSPNYPKKYPKYTDCHWRIQTTVGSKVQLTFNEFNLESKYDYITIFDGSNTDSTKLGHYTGNILPTVPLSSSNVLIIHMKSDHSKEKKGFQAAFRTVLFDGDKDSCGGSLTADDHTRWFTSPRYPQYYPDNLVCDWVITAQNKDNIITLQFGDFEFESPYDWIEVRNGDSSSSKLFERFSGDNLPKVVISTQSELFVRMNSDFSYGMKGFNATYKIGCDIDIINGFAKIESPGYGVTKYPNNLNCIWRIADLNRRHLTLNFNTDFNTEKKSDIVLVYNDSSQPVQFSGKITPQPTYSNNGKFQVHFTSDKRIQRSGWTASVSYDCDKLVVNKPVIINSTSNYYGSIIQYSCDKGYILHGPTITCCDINGVWRPNQIPTCSLINCGPPRIPENGMIVKLDTITYGGKVQYDCIEGYELLGDRYSFCNQDGWTAIPTCNEIYCPKVLPPTNGIVFAEDNRYGASLLYICKEGYRLVGSAEAHCQADKTWSSPTPTCQAYHCPIIKGIENGDVNTTEWVYINQAVKIICNHGYKPSSDPVLICMENEKYDKPIPSCDDINECLNDDDNDCHEHECQNIIGSYQCSCKPGYHHSIGTNTTCQDINECSISNGNCNQVCNNTKGGYYCSCYSSVYELYDGPEIVLDDRLLKPGHTCIAPCEPLKVLNGEVFYHGTVLPDGRYIFPTEAYITCPENTIPDGVSKIQCQSSGGWTDSVTECQASNCVELDKISNGYVSDYKTSPGSVVQYHCFKGYKLVGIDRRICQLTSIDTTNRLEYRWTGIKPSCAPIDCSMLPDPSNGLVTVTGTRYGDVATFNCYCGFELEGSKIRHCSANGSWSGINTQCNSVGCRKPEVPVYGSIINEQDTYPVGSIIQYQCDRKGYTLSDPSPVQCISEKNYHSSTHRPKYQLSVQFQYTLDSILTLNPCNIFYQDQLEILLQEFLDNSMFCNTGEVSVTVLQGENKPQINDTKMLLVIDLEISILNNTDIHVACTCGNDLKTELAKNIQYIDTLQSNELTCPIASLNQDIEKESDSKWKCLPGHELDNNIEVCNTDIDPICIQGCIERFPDLIEPIETTLSTSSIDIDMTTNPKTDATTSYFAITTLEPEVTTFEVEATSNWETTTISMDTTISGDKTTDRPLTGITTWKTTPGNTNTVTSPSSPSPSPSSITDEATETTQGYTSTSVSITEDDLSTSSTSGSTSTDMIPEVTTETDFTSGFSSTSESSTSTTAEDFSTGYAFSTTDSSLQYSSSTQDSTEGTGDISSEGPISTEITQTKSSTVSTSAQESSSREPSSTDGSPTPQRPASTTQPETTTRPSTTQLLSTPEVPITHGSQEPLSTQGPSSTQGTSSTRGTQEKSSTQDPPVTTHPSNTQGISTSQGPPLTQKPSSQGTTTDGLGTTIYPGTTLPTPFNASLPVYLIAVYDKLNGSFNDMCIDNVHSYLNNIVTSILTSFQSKGGCQNSSDLTILLQTGTAGFRNTYVDIDIVFGISTANKDGIQSCVVEFKGFLSTTLPKLLSNLQQTNLVPTYCTYLNYTGDMFNITDSYWGCMDDYILNDMDWICEDPNVADLSIRAEDAPSGYRTVDTVPTLIIKFNGGLQNNNAIPKGCREYYEQGLQKIFENLEPVMNSKSSEDCKDIYISVADHISVKISGKKVDTSAHIYLYPQSNSINSSRMERCKLFVLSVFTNPVSHSLSLIKPLNFNKQCSSLIRLPASLTLKHKYDAHESCCEECDLDTTNYKCIHKNIPSYQGFYTVRFIGSFDKKHCGNSLEESTKISLIQFYMRIKSKVNQLCQSHSVILDPISSVKLVTGSDFVTVKFPIVLKSVENKQNETVECYNKITKNIDVILTTYGSVLLTNLSHKCKKLSTDSIQPEIGWQCNSGYVFNSATLTCNKKTDIKKGKGRGKRSIPVTFSNNKPYWNSSVPQCHDTMKPEMINCQPLSMFSLGEHGPVPVHVDLPQIQDNSGYPPTIQFIPSDFRLPYTFTDIPMSILHVKATDNAGNEAVCTIQIHQMDVTPPRVRCPEDVHKVYYDGDNISVAIDYSDVNITASDFSGISSHIKYLPAPNTTIEMMDVITVKAIVFDNNNLNSTCYFKYQAQSSSCPYWSLETPANGDKACSGNIGGNNASGYSCSVKCPRGYDFAVKEVNQYICTYGGSWTPHNYVPDCTEQIYPNYELLLAFNFTYNGLENDDCIKSTLKDIFNELEQSIKKGCSDNNLNITVNINSSLVLLVDIRLKMYVNIEILNSSNTPPNIAKNCGLKIIAMINNSTDFVVSTESCGNSTLLPPADAIHGDKCPHGHIFKNNYCLACTKGTYKDVNLNKCIDCAVGWYQDEVAQTSCKLCAENTSTESVHSKNSSQCILKCKEGEYSSNGLFPCNQCSIGYYQFNTSSTACTACPINYSTVDIGSTSFYHCKERCGVGYVSNTGLEPCQPCPLHYYSSNISSLVCTECPNTTVTNSNGSTSLQDCVEVDQCENNLCENGATCVNKFRYFTCSCAQGFTGDTCHDNIDDCFSQPCLNNGSCTDGIDSFQCTCQSGYNGTNCETELDLCTPDYCQHGVCVQKQGVKSCQCFSGYQGDRCTDEIDECYVYSVNCKNGGICKDLLDDFICDCSGTGFHGRYCDINIDDCCDCSCLNGGTCNDLIKDFNCSCAEGFTGTRCEIMVSYCTSSPCKHDSICTDKPNGFTCTCQPGYEGILCELEVDECQNQPCLNQATCSDNVNYYNCSCPSGFTGKNCDINVDDCLQASCNTAGTDYCVDGVNEYQCVCLPYWTGDLCENKIDQCQEQPCYNNATCTSIHDAYRCTCLPDYTGSTCSVQIDDCLDKPCLHNGICIDGINNYTCNCAGGFEGRNCQININECDPNPCKNDAKCSDLINGFTCRCEAGWNGTLCDINIDDCTSQPCFNNATCDDLINDFSCNCTDGYDGKTCDNNIDDCYPQPCQNGGSCTDLIGNFSCLCPEEYEGHQCEYNIDDCIYNNTCLNNATCIDGWRDTTCQCTPYYTGDDCGKEKTDDYDLLFHGLNGSICQPDDIDIVNNQMSLCFWLRFADVKGYGTYFNLIDVIRAKPILVLSSSDYTVSIDTQFQQGELNVNDGYWHHICFLHTSSSWSLYKDGDIVDTSTAQDISVPESQRIVLGQSEDVNINQAFHGEISQLNVYNYTLNESVIYELASNCTNRLSGNILEWRVVNTYIKHDVDIIQPTICGSSICPPGYRGTKCDIKIDKIPPLVNNCPEDIIKVTNGSARVAVIWEDPDFTDDIGVTVIQQTHRSGQVFPLGEYFVSYIAYDAENNSAECNFGIIVKPFDCINPPAPKNGLVARKDWEHGRFCVISCIDPVLYDFVEFPPPFYRCGKEGFWDPPRGNPFRFPPCAALFPPQSNVEGGLGFNGLECTEERKEELRVKFIQILSELDERLGLCSPGPCTYEGVVVECGTDGESRVKRSVSDFKVNFNFNISSNSSALQDGNKDFIAEEIETLVKNGDFDTTDFQADENTLSVAVKLECEPGQSSRLVQGTGTHWKCVNCPEGYYLDNNECLPCDIGQYTDKEKQMTCKQCPVGMTTGSLASTNISQCYSLCDVGHYYESISSNCIKCNIGEYQDQSGQTQCKSCPIGETTTDIGSTSITDCGNLCKLGEELSVTGECVKCPKGSYRDDLDQQYCQACPYGWTTSDIGSTSILQCTVAYCQRGEYLSEDNTCELCEKGTYQPIRGQTSCIACGIGLTTSNKGSTSPDDCKAGPVDECRLDIDDCDDNAECVDEDNGFSCVCNFGFTGNKNGSVCTDNCDNKCDIHGQCNYDNNGHSFCTCQDGYQGERCDQEEVGVSGAIIGGVTGTAVAIAIITVVIIVLFSRRKTKSNEFQSNERIYRNKQPSLVAFQNGAYEVLDADSVSDFFMESLNANRWSRSVYSRVNENMDNFSWSDEIELETTFTTNMEADHFEPIEDYFTSEESSITRPHSYSSFF